MRSLWAQRAIFLMLVVAGGFLFLTPHVFAQADQAAVAATAGLGTASLPEIIGRIISVFLGLLGVIFLILTIYAGFLWMTAGGDDKKVEKAKRILVQATVGLVICLAAYGIAAFVVNIISNSTGNGGGAGGGGNGGVSVETLSGAFGAGPIRDHYPARNQTDVPRNAKVMITFKEAIDPASVTVSSVKIFPTAAGAAGALTDVTINTTEDHKTFAFKPAVALGSATADVQYTVQLTADIKNAGGTKIFSGAFSGGYKWSFETGTVLDLTPPTVVTVTPANAGTFSRNIVVQATFSEPVDPTSASGVKTGAGGFDNIVIGAGPGAEVAGEYQISNGYTSVTFIPRDPCGTNSCGTTIMCLPGNNGFGVVVKGATATNSPPQADAFPYDGVVDMAGNALDGNHDGTVGDAYTWSFSTTGDIALAGPKILSIAPNIAEEDVPLDQTVTITFDDVLMTSSVSQDTVELTNKELSSGSSHEMWFSPSTSYLTSDDQAVTSSAQVPAKTVVEVNHGTFLQSVDGKTYAYGATVLSGLLNEYQNCYVPGVGPDATGGTCGVSAAEPYCCNGVPSSAACVLF
jgi:hypothetical protein